MGQSPPGETCNQKGLGIPLLNGPSEFGSYHPTPIQFTIDSRKLAKKMICYSAYVALQLAE